MDDLQALSLFGDGAYQQALQKFESDFHEAFGYAKQRKIFEEFTRKYTTVPEIWKKWFEFEIDFTRKHLIEELRQRALKHFYSEEFIPCLTPETPIVNDFSKLTKFPFIDIIRFKCYNINPKIFAEGLELAEKALAFPHNKLDEIFKIYSSKKEVSEKVLKNFRYSKFLYYLLSKAEHEDEKWICFLRMHRDTHFKIQNIEFRIAQNPFNLKLWKLYIEYLKETKNIKVLEVYSKACRFFLEDAELLEEYRNEIEAIQSRGNYVGKWWIDTIQYEVDFGTHSSTKKVIARALNSNISKKELGRQAREFENEDVSGARAIESMLPNYGVGCVNDLNEEELMEEDEDEFSTYDRPWGQRFSLPSPILFHVLKNANHQLLFEMFKTCKTFFSKFKIVLCSQLMVSPLCIKGFSPNLSCQKLQLKEIVNFYVTHDLSVNYNSDPDLLTRLRTILYKCDAHTLSITGQHVTLKNLMFFIENVNSIFINNCTITKDTGEALNIHEMIELFEKADRIKMGCEIGFSDQTFPALASMQRETKLKMFTITNVPQNVNPFDFAAFMKNNAEASAIFNIYFAPNVNEMFKQEFLYATKAEYFMDNVPDHPAKLNVF